MINKKIKKELTITATYLGIENLRNYNLKSSVISGLIQEFELSGLDANWLIDYKNNSNLEKEYAKQVGISVNCWKNCLCSLIFGVSLNTPSVAKNLNSVIDNLANEADGDTNKFTEYCINFYQVVKPFKKELDKWHKSLHEVVEKSKYRATEGKFFIKNAIENELCITDLYKEYEEWEIISKLASFVILGRESCFIHHLTTLSKEYNYQVIENEHNSLIILGVIPEEAVQKAAESSGLKDPILEEEILYNYEYD